MVISADADYITEALADSSRPRVVVEIVLDASTVTESDIDGNPTILTTGRIDRLKDKEASTGVSFAGQCMITLDNIDEAFTRGAGGTYDEGLKGKTVTVYHYFALADDPELFLSDDTHLSDTTYLAEEITGMVQMFKGVVDRIKRTGPARQVQITVLDNLRSLAAEEFAADGSASGLSVEVIKDIIDTYTSLTYNTAAYARALQFAVGTYCTLAWSAGDKVLDAIKQVHQAFGTSCWSDEDDEIHIDIAPIRFGQFLDIRRALENDAYTYNGDESTRPDYWNLKSITAEELGSKTINRVTLTYLDSVTGESATCTEEDTDSQDDYGINELTFSTDCQITPAQARIWPRRLIERFSGQADFITQAQATLRKAVLNQVGDVVVVTDPATGLSAVPFEVTRLGKSLTACHVDLEADPYDNEKWCRAGSDNAGTIGSDRPSAQIDFLYNKSFEDGLAGVPTKWSLDGGSGGTFAVTADDARDTTIGVRSLHVVSAGDDSVYSQTIAFNPLVNGTSYIMSFYVKGAVSVGSFHYGFEDSTAFSTLSSLSTTYATWTRITKTLTAGANLPYKVLLKMNGCTCDLYIDDIQIDEGGSAEAFQENWATFGYAGKDDGDANPGFDSAGNADGDIDATYLEGLEKQCVAY